MELGGGAAVSRVLVLGAEDHVRNSVLNNLFERCGQEAAPDASQGLHSLTLKTKYYTAELEIHVHEVRQNELQTPLQHDAEECEAIVWVTDAASHSSFLETEQFVCRSTLLFRDQCKAGHIGLRSLKGRLLVKLLSLVAIQRLLGSSPSRGTGGQEDAWRNMLDTVQNVAVVTANAFIPGSGALVNGGFELAKIAYQISLVLVSMEEKAALIKSQLKSIEEDVEDFQFTLDMLGRVQNQDQLPRKLQKVIVDFHSHVEDYDHVVARFTTRSVIKQLLYRSELVSVCANAKQASEKVQKRINAEFMLDASPTYRSNRLSVDQVLIEREKRSLAYADSPEIWEVLSDSDTQKEVLATITSMGRRDEMQGKSSAADPVLRVIKQKVWASSSAAVRNEILNLPSWYVTENEIESMASSIKLGFGGDAKVYEATHAGESVAIKVYRTNSLRDEQAKLRFVVSMNLWQRLQHPNICRFYGACYLHENPFAVMELCDGGSLETFLRRDESARRQVALEMLIHAAQGLLKMHTMGIVHCDFKADNILINTLTKQAKICDFDRSFDWTALKTKRLVTGSAETAGVSISDAVRWLAPECIEGRVPSSASDVYSFGMTIYQALTGEPPYFESNEEEEVRACILAHELPMRNQRISEDAWKLIKECCDPLAQRRPTMDSVLKSLKTLVLVGNHSHEVAEGDIESQVDASMDVKAAVDIAGKAVILGGGSSMDPTRSNDSTPVKAVKAKVRLDPKTRTVIVLGLLLFAVVAVAGGVVSSVRSSGTNTSTNSDGGPSGTPTPEPTTVTPTATATPTPTTTTAVPTPEPTTVTPTAAATPTPTTTTVVLTPGATTVTPTPTPTPTPTTAAPTPEPTTMTPTPTTTTAVPAVTRVSTIAGSGSSYSRVFSGLSGVAVASDGYIYLSDENRILQLTDGSDTSVYSGSLYDGATDGSRTGASYSAPRAMAVSSGGDLYICDYGNQVIRKITGGSTVSTFSSTTFTDLRGITVDSNGVVYVTNGNSNKVTKLTSAGTASTFTTSTTGPMGAAVDSSGTVYITDMHTIKKISSTGTATVLAGATTAGYIDATGTSAQFSSPKALAIGSDGNIYVADTGNNCIRKLTLSTNAVTTYAGVCQSYGSTDGDATSAKFDGPRGIAASSSAMVLYVTDGGNSVERLRKIYIS